MSCTRSQEFLATKQLTVTEFVRADKQPIDEGPALALVRSARRLIVAKGKKTTTVLLASKPSDDELRALVLGPTGRLRAPAIRIGDTLVIGFTPEGLDAALG